jgi:hypothetical protein
MQTVSHSRVDCGPDDLHGGEPLSTLLSTEAG